MDFEQPRKSRPRLNEAFIQKVLNLWKIPGSLHEIVDLGGAYNANWRVSTTMADVVVRVRPEWITLERIFDVHLLIQRLHDYGIPSAVPRRCTNGETYAIVEGHVVELYDYLPEEGNRRWSAARWQASFEHMGRLHRALSAIGFNILPPNRSNYATPRLAALMIEVTKSRIETLPGSRNKKEAMAICEEARQIVETICQYWEGVQGRLPNQLVHGDFHLDNLLFNKADQVKYTLDFDFVAWRERVYELAYAFRLALPQLTENADGMLNQTLINKWIEVYNEYAPHPLTPLERQALPYQMALVSLFHIGNSSRIGNPLWVVLREVNYVELARYLITCPNAFCE